MIKKIKHTIASMPLLIAMGIQEPAANDCKIEDWTWRHDNCWIMIEGTTTCNYGRVTLRLYDENGKFLGLAADIIRGYSIRPIGPKICKALNTLKIRYTIQ